MLELKQVSKFVDGQTHIDDVSLELSPGSFNVLLGPTLSGKTTLMRLMSGLDAPSSGRILFAGKDVTGMPVRQRNVAMVYQQFINYQNLSVYDNIASPLRLAKLERGELDKKVKEAAQLLQISEFLERKPASLSGGQQQRTALARALVKQADLILLDEPLANLDYKLRENLRQELPKIFAEKNSILVYATAEPSEALLLGGSTVVLSEGKLAQIGPTAASYRNPDTLEAARIFSDPPLNSIKVEKRGENFHADGGEQISAGSKAESLADGSYILGLRAHHLSMQPGNESAVKLSATVEVTEITGSESFVHIDWHGEKWIMLSPGVHALSIGQRLDVFIDTEHLLVFDEKANAVRAN